MARIIDKDKSELYKKALGKLYIKLSTFPATRTDIANVYGVSKQAVYDALRRIDSKNNHIMKKKKYLKKITPIQI